MENKKIYVFGCCGFTCKDIKKLFEKTGLSPLQSPFDMTDELAAKFPRENLKHNVYLDHSKNVKIGQMLSLYHCLHKGLYFSAVIDETVSEFIDTLSLPLSERRIHSFKLTNFFQRLLPSCSTSHIERGDKILFDHIALLTNNRRPGSLVCYTLDPMNDNELRCFMCNNLFMSEQEFNYFVKLTLDNESNSRVDTNKQLDDKQKVELLKTMLIYSTDTDTVFKNLGVQYDVLGINREILVNASSSPDQFKMDKQNNQQASSQIHHTQIPTPQIVYPSITQPSVDINTITKMVEEVLAQKKKQAAYSRSMNRQQRTMHREDRRGYYGHAYDDYNSDDTDSCEDDNLRYSYKTPGHSRGRRLFRKDNKYDHDSYDEDRQRYRSRSRHRRQKDSFLADSPRDQNRCQSRHDNCNAINDQEGTLNDKLLELLRPLINKDISSDEHPKPTKNNDAKVDNTNVLPTVFMDEIKNIKQSVLDNIEIQNKTTNDLLKSLASQITDRESKIISEDSKKDNVGEKNNTLDKSSKKEMTNQEPSSPTDDNDNNDKVNCSFKIGESETVKSDANTHLSNILEIAQNT